LTTSAPSGMTSTAEDGVITPTFTVSYSA
jgi:hypothetical protein